MESNKEPVFCIFLFQIALIGLSRDLLILNGVLESFVQFYVYKRHLKIVLHNGVVPLKLVTS